MSKPTMPGYSLKLLIFPLLVAITPIALYFRRDFNFSNHPEVNLLYLLLYSISSTSILLILTLSLYRLWQRNLSISLLVTLLLSLLIGFMTISQREEIVFRKEIVFFEANRATFMELITVATQPTCEVYCDLPETINLQDKGQRIFVIKGGLQVEVLLVSFPSRPNTNITYLPDHSDLPDNQLRFPLGYKAICDYQLQDHWFICEVYG